MSTGFCGSDWCLQGNKSNAISYRADQLCDSPWQPRTYASLSVLQFKGVYEQIALIALVF